MVLRIASACLAAQLGTALAVHTSTIEGSARGSLGTCRDGTVQGEAEQA